MTNIGWTDGWRIDINGATIWVTFADAVTLHETLGELIGSRRKQQSPEEVKAAPQEQAPKVDPAGTTGCSTERRWTPYVDVPATAWAHFGFRQDR